MSLADRGFTSTAPLTSPRSDRIEVVIDEASLLERARLLDQDALAQIHDDYYLPIYRYVALRVGNRQLAEDLSSEVFTRLLSALRSGSAPQQTVRGWLYGVASRVVSDHFRQQYRRPMVELDDAMPARSTPLEESLDQTLTWEQLHLALKTLNQAQQEVIALRFGQGLPIKDVARSMGKSVGAIKQLQARAVANLAQELSVTSR